jgi:hypothetical protein
MLRFDVLSGSYPHVIFMLDVLVTRPLDSFGETGLLGETRLSQSVSSVELDMLKR